MIKMTDDAKEALHRLLMVRGSTGMSFRLIQSPSDMLGIILDRQSRKDRVIMHNGVKILFVGKDILPLIQDSTIDIKRENAGCKLVINSN